VEPRNENPAPEAALQSAAPIPMLLFCPRCGMQHIDAPSPEEGWINPPHRSHKCAACRTVWRPADVATTGVAEILTRGSSDDWLPDEGIAAGRLFDDVALARALHARMPARMPERRPASVKRAIWDAGERKPEAAFETAEQFERRAWIDFARVVRGAVAPFLPRPANVDHAEPGAIREWLASRPRPAARKMFESGPNRAIAEAVEDALAASAMRWTPVGAPGDEALPAGAELVLVGADRAWWATGGRRPDGTWWRFERDGRVVDAPGITHFARLRPPNAPAEVIDLSFQARAARWCADALGQSAVDDPIERGHRFFEEAAELAQAAGISRHDAMVLVDYVYSRPVGEIKQETGGVLVTLAILAASRKIDLLACGETELARVIELKPIIAAKQAAKAHGTPLPGGARARSVAEIRVDIERLARDPATRFRTRDALLAMLDADPVDCCNDAEVMATLARELCGAAIRELPSAVSA